MRSSVPAARLGLPLLLVGLALPARAALAPAQGPVRRVDARAEQRELVGKPLGLYPHFQITRTFNAGEPIWIAFDPEREPRLALRTLDVYLIDHAALPAVLSGMELTGLGGAPVTVRLVAGGLKENVFLLDPGTLDGSAVPDVNGTHILGRGYDVAVDVDRNGRLNAGDLVDGERERVSSKAAEDAKAGFYVVANYVQFAPTGPLETGPYQVIEVLVDELNPRMDVYFPETIAALGELPLIVVSHGNGHFYQWYDHIGFHMASWGYVVMSHVNNTGPGIETASTSTLTATELFLGNSSTIAQGQLAGHVDGHRIVWIGHSRGGEGVVRAYRRLELGTPLATRYTLDDIKLVSSIAPTDFLGSGSDMGAAPYHLWTGGADADVNGCADCNICQTFHLLERADGTRYSTSLHGVGHGAFLADGGGSLVATGPCLVLRGQTHALMRAILLPLVQHALDGNPACLDFLTRQWEEFRALDAPDPAENVCIVVDQMYLPGPERAPLVIDDFQSEPERARSSSGGAVRWSSGLDLSLHEGRFDDANGNFTRSDADLMNGMTLAGRPEDTSAGVVLEWNATGEWLTFEVPQGARDLSGLRTLSFRAAQATRDELTTAELGDLDFAVQLTDAATRSRTIRIGAYGGGIEEPYQRSACGTGQGWANEFETIRIPLGDFGRGGNPLDLHDVVAITFLFGPQNGSPAGRIGLDEIELTRD